jgi:membrane fusion protein (multidrug efflux system)
VSQASPSPRDRSSEPTPLNRNLAPAPSEPATPSAPAAPTKPAPAAAPLTAPAPRRRSGFGRFLLIVVLPVAAVALALLWWLSGGRYITTDNAYVGADKVLITPQVTGAIAAVHVREGQKVAVGDALFDIDPAPYRTALALARGRLAAAKVEFANLRASFASNVDQIRMGQEAVDLRQADYDRKVALVASHAGTRVEADTSAAALVQAKQILEFVRQQQEATKVKLGGGLEATIDTFPDYIQATAQVEDAERNLRNANVTAPIAGVATQVDQIELGRVAPAGQPVFAVVADTGLWVDANPKESDLTYVRAGQAATVTIDAFPGREWRGKVSSIAPGTGAQFAILPPQNASGNWVKVVQRVPLRFAFAADQDVANLRAGMSANLSIDTGRTRSLGGLWNDLSGWVLSWLDGSAQSKPR